MGTLRRTCAKVRELSDLRFGIVCGVGRGIAVLDVGPRRTRGRGFCFSIFIIENSHCAASSLLLGQFLELRGAWASASRAGFAHARNS